MKERESKLDILIGKAQHTARFYLRKIGIRQTSKKSVYDQIREAGELPESWGKPSDLTSSELWQQGQDDDNTS
jgi:hypothetical protein